MTTNILDQIRQRHALPNARPNAAVTATESYNPIQRQNYLTLANATELATEIICGVIRVNPGIGAEMAGQRLLKRDIADMVASRLNMRMEQLVKTREETGK